MVESDAIDDLVREKIKSLDVECLWWRAGGARAGARGVRDVPAILLPDWQPDEKFANHEHHSNRALLCPVRPPRAAIAAMCSSMSSLEHGRRIGQLVYLWQSSDSRKRKPGLAHDNRQCVLPRWPDAPHNRNDSSTNGNRSAKSTQSKLCDA